MYNKVPQSTIKYHNIPQRATNLLLGHIISANAAFSLSLSFQEHKVLKSRLFTVESNFTIKITFVN